MNTVLVSRIRSSGISLFINIWSWINNPVNIVRAVYVHHTALDDPDNTESPLHVGLILCRTLIKNIPGLWLKICVWYRSDILKKYCSSISCFVPIKKNFTWPLIKNFILRIQDINLMTCHHHSFNFFAIIHSQRVRRRTP